VRRDKQVNTDILILIAGMVPPELAHNVVEVMDRRSCVLILRRFIVGGHDDGVERTRASENG